MIIAAPGAGKTTRVPPALLADGPVILLQPRRVAARAIAARIAAERGWTLGREVGWQVRFERRFSADTRLLVVTEGILTARLQHDPLLSDFTTVILDEFHERSVHADLAIALARQAWRARADLRLVVMSATLEAQPVSAFLDDCPVDRRPGPHLSDRRLVPPGQSVADAASDLLRRDRRPGAVLPARCGRDSSSGRRAPAHGRTRRRGRCRSMDRSTPTNRIARCVRRRAAGSSSRRTSPKRRSTVPGVTAVVDAGLQKVARYDAERGIDSLETERITLDAADQRAGRAGRLAPGDRAATVGCARSSAAAPRAGDPSRRSGERRPRRHRLGRRSCARSNGSSGREKARSTRRSMLSRLGLVVGATDSRRCHRPALTPIGEQVRVLPLHPRLGRMLVAGGGARKIAQACALLSERHMLPPRTASTSSDLLSAIDEWSSVPPHVQQVAAQLSNVALSNVELRTSDLSEREFRRAILSGYPDRVAQRREPGSPTFSSPAEPAQRWRQTAACTRVSSWSLWISGLLSPSRSRQLGLRSSPPFASRALSIGNGWSRRFRRRPPFRG